MLDFDATASLLAQEPRRTALFADFDGSLAKIVDDPAAARPLPAVVPVLARLVEVLGRVGIVSGRPVDFLATHLPVPELTLVGQYGLESIIDGVERIDERALRYRDGVRAAGDDADARLPGVFVERKGLTAVTLHFRTAPGAAEAAQAVADELAARYGLELHPGRKSVELRPPVPIDKGVSVLRLVDGFAVGAFAGDDAGDLPAFNALERAANAGTIKTAVRIGVDSPEAPAGLRTSVDHLVAGPEGLLQLLEAVAQRIAS